VNKAEVLDRAFLAIKPIKDVPLSRNVLSTDLPFQSKSSPLNLLPPNVNFPPVEGWLEELNMLALILLPVVLVLPLAVLRPDGAKMSYTAVAAAAMAPPPTGTQASMLSRSFSRRR